MLVHGTGAFLSRDRRTRGPPPAELSANGCRKTTCIKSKDALVPSRVSLRPEKCRALVVIHAVDSQPSLAKWTQTSEPMRPEEPVTRSFFMVGGQGSGRSCNYMGNNTKLSVSAICALRATGPVT
jgi:hypothetical protein